MTADWRAGNHAKSCAELQPDLQCATLAQSAWPTVPFTSPILLDPENELTLAFICYPTGSSRIFRISVNHRTLSNALVKVQPKGQMTIPRRVRSAVGPIDGDLVEVRAIGKRIIVTPQLVIDRSKFPTADDEYTPEQRRIVTARLNKAEKGPFFGPFKNGVEVAAFLKRKARSAARFAKTKIR
jgi:AbrB family looped-hinge helix DNA binding protein